MFILTAAGALQIIRVPQFASFLKVSEPLSLIPDRYLFLQTNNVDELAEKLSWSRLHRIELLSHRNKLASKVSYVPLREMTIGELTVTGNAKDSLGSAESAFILLMGVHGRAEQRMGGKLSEISAAKTVVHNPGRTAVVRMTGHWQALSIGIRRETLIRELENHLGRAVSAEVELAPVLDMASLSGVGLRRNMLKLCEILKRQSHRPQTLLAALDAQRSMISHLIESHRHNYTRSIHRAAAAAPWQVRAAEEFMRANPGDPISIGDLAAIAGVSARTLQHSFRQHRGISPMQFLRDIRLQCVHRDLLWDGNIRTVAEAAVRWGFFHFGRFAAAYTQRHGESPSATLRRSRRRFL